MHPTIATRRIGADGSTRFAAAGHEMGQGIRSTIEQVLVRVLAIDASALEIAIGDPSVAPQHVTAGSWGTASVVPAAEQAAARLKAAVADLLGGRTAAGDLHRQLATVRRPFVEVHVEPHTRRIRVPRGVSIADCGRVVSPRTAASQVRGGGVWGISACLREASEVDPRYGGCLSNDLADYAIAVNADLGEIDVGFVDRPDDLFNALGAKGPGRSR